MAKASKAERSQSQDVITNLERQIQHETQLRDTIIWSNTSLEKSLKSLETQIQNLQEGNDVNLPPEAVEWKLRYETQLNINADLQNQLDWLKEQVESAKLKAKADVLVNPSGIDLECFTESELARLVDQLQRERNNLHGDLRNIEWQLDNESKEYHRLADLRRAYSLEMTSLKMPSSGWGSQGISPDQRILDPSKGPVKKTAGVRNLPRLELFSKSSVSSVDVSHNGSEGASSQNGLGSSEKSEQALLKSKSENDVNRPLSISSNISLNADLYKAPSDNGLHRHHSLPMRRQYRRTPAKRRAKSQQPKRGTSLINIQEQNSSERQSNVAEHISKTKSKSESELLQRQKLEVEEFQEPEEPKRSYGRHELCTLEAKERMLEIEKARKKHAASIKKSNKPPFIV